MAARGNAGQAQMLKWFAVTAVVALLLLGGVALGVRVRRQAATPASTPTADVETAMVPNREAILRYGREPGAPNRLANSPSLFLQMAKDQPVNWYEWGQEAFQIAQELDMPILVDVGAAWCLWCEVMDAESYRDPRIADRINGFFIPIRVDRDAQPHVDTRLQTAVQALSGASGWPLTVFMTPDGHPFSGTSYLPPVTREGRPGLVEILREVALTYHVQRQDVENTADRIRRQIVDSYEELAVPSLVTSVAVTTIGQALREKFDYERGGWPVGDAKFPNGPAIEFGLGMYESTGDTAWLDLATRTLDALATGGLRDHIMGGMFRASSDLEWGVPHFEKLLSVNAMALTNFAHAYELTGEERYREAALGIVDYLQSTGTDQARGGFYAHQAGHVTLRDEGAYSTWTLTETRQVLTPDEAQVVIPYYGIEATPRYAPLGAPQRNVLRISATPEELAQELGLTVEEVQTLIARGTQRMAEARAQQPAPRVDTALYTSWNALAISAYLRAAQTFGRTDLAEFALKTTDFLLANAYQPGKGMVHSLYHGTPYVEGLFEDQAFMAQALLDAYQYSGEARYLQAAQDLIDRAIVAYWDGSQHGFYDIATTADPAGLRNQPYKSIIDTEIPAANPIAALVLMRLGDTLDDADYRLLSGQTMAAFAGSAGKFDTRTATYALVAQTEFIAPAQEKEE